METKKIMKQSDCAKAAILSIVNDQEMPPETRFSVLEWLFSKYESDRRMEIYESKQELTDVRDCIREV